ncbi:MAG: DUF192 domain-containing protein [Candidatus Hadarchaeia archaeon]
MDPKAKKALILTSLITAIALTYLIGSSLHEDETEGLISYENYDQTKVRILGPERKEKGSVIAIIADTTSKKIIGLSKARSLPNNRGMLFVFEKSQRLNFWMKNMSFGLDMIFAEENGCITKISRGEAPSPNENGDEPHHRYTADGMFVLEVRYGWTLEKNVKVGDVLNFDLN